MYPYYMYIATSYTLNIVLLCNQVKFFNVKGSDKSLCTVVMDDSCHIKYGGPAVSAVYRELNLLAIIDIQTRSNKN